MSKLKDLFMEIEDADDVSDENAVEVYADSVKQALELASEDLNVDIVMLDYEILEKGTKGIFGIGRQPFRILISVHEGSTSYDDIDEIERKLTGEHTPIIKPEERKDVDGSFRLRVTKKGIWFEHTPPKGKGKKIDIMDVNGKLYSMKLTNTDISIIEKEITSPKGNPINLGKWTPNMEHDGSISIEVTEDEMKAFIHFTPPRFAGRHLEYDEIIESLKNAGVVTGINEDKIKEYLNDMDYHQPLLAAEGTKPRNGKDAYIEYKIRIGSSGVNFEEDPESGKVDFKNLELLENVVVGQLLALKVPLEDGIEGRSVTNRILPAKSGKDTKLQYGKGTIVSEDGTELSAEINGQVVFKVGKISVEPVYVVNGDVSLETGNIVFLGSVIISGSVQDNFIVKAAGNIEVKGTVQKAFLEAEGDIIVHQGISGRDEAKVESTGGSIFAKFVQNANLMAEVDVLVPEGILHSNVDAGGKLYCNGRRAKITGGVIRAGDEVNVRFLGAEVSTSTEVRVGVNPKILQQISELDDTKVKIEEELGKMILNLKTLQTQKKSTKLSEDKEKMLDDLESRNSKLTTRLQEVSEELEEQNEYIGMMEHKGKICVEKKVYPGVDIYIKDQKFVVKDEYSFIKFTLEGGEIRLSEYEEPEFVEGEQRIATLVRRR